MKDKYYLISVNEFGLGKKNVWRLDDKEFDDLNKAKEYLELNVGMDTQDAIAYLRLLYNNN